LIRGRSREKLGLERFLRRISRHRTFLRRAAFGHLNRFFLQRFFCSESSSSRFISCRQPESGPIVVIVCGRGLWLGELLALDRFSTSRIRGLSRSCLSLTAADPGSQHQQLQDFRGRRKLLSTAARRSNAFGRMEIGERIRARSTRVSLASRSRPIARLELFSWSRAVHFQLDLEHLAECVSASLSASAIAFRSAIA